MTDTLDECIEEHCLDADVLALVLNAENTLTKAVS